MADALKASSYLRDADTGWIVTPGPGKAWFSRFGIKVLAQDVQLVRTCLDWSERRYHQAEALRGALTERCFAMGWVARVRQSRTVRLTDRGGRAALQVELGITL